MTEYVVGFAYDIEGRVALIRKNRPEWQAGRLNGIGGHVEEGETPDEAMRREFGEETGHWNEGLDWELFVVMDFPGARIYFFRTEAGSQVLNNLYSRTDEEIVIRHWPLSEYAKDEPFIPNLSWLIPLARYSADRYEPVQVTATVAEVVD